MDDADKMERVCGYLRLIERTRLLKNTTEELEQLVGFSVGSGNGLARKGGKSLFMKDAIFRELAHIAKQATDLDLQEVLDAYVCADRICERMGNVANPALFCQHLVWFFYSDAEVTDDIASVIDKVEADQLPILVLLMLKLLPRLSAKGGDVRDIRQDYRRLFSWLSETVNKDIIMQKLPLLTLIEDDVRRSPDIMCRIHLISTASLILNSYGALSTRERISIGNKELLENQFDPGVEGIWTENEFTTVFWQYERIANGYHLYCYQADSSRKSLAFTKFFMKFFHWGDDIMALVIHPHAIRYLVSGKKIPNNLFAYLDCHIQVDSKGNSDAVIGFSPQSEDGQWFALRQLRRSEKEVFFQSLLNDERYEKTNSHANDDYDFTLYYDISTLELMAEHQIEVVDRISV